MKEQLTIEHLAPYLPYGLTGMFRGRKETLKSCTSVFINREILYNDFKPILRPLSDLINMVETKEENEIAQLYGLSSYSHEVFNKLIENKIEPYFLEQWIFEILIKNHFDVFGLIEKGLAMDVNKLKQDQ